MHKFLIACLCLCSISQANAWDLIELGDINLENRSYFDHSNMSLIEGANVNRSTALDIDMIVLGGAHLKTTLLSQTENGSQQLIGLAFEYGINWTDWLETGYWYGKAHTADFQSANNPGGWKEEGIIIRIRLHKGAHTDAVY